MNQEKLQQIRIQAEARRRPSRPLWIIFLGVAVVSGIAVFYMWPRATDRIRVMDNSDESKRTTSNAGRENAGGGSLLVNASASSSRVASTNQESVATGRVEGSVLTVSGYIVNRERIELSPRFLGVVKWIGVKKGDAVTNGQVVALLDDAEYRARLKEAEGRLANAQVGVRKAELDFKRARELVASKVEMQKIEDDARLQLESSRALVQEIEGQIELLKIYLSWTVIQSPINGVVLEKLVDPNEIVVPQTFGGTRGPSTALISVADPTDLQVEIELNESDVSKAFLKQKCKISPEAYLDRVYDGYVVEIAPEANRQKGTLQVKVQIANPDKYLTPELSAKVDFLGRPAPASASPA